MSFKLSHHLSLNTRQIFTFASFFNISSYFFNSFATRVDQPINILNCFRMISKNSQNISFSKTTTDSKCINDRIILEFFFFLFITTSSSFLSQSSSTTFQTTSSSKDFSTEVNNLLPHCYEHSLDLSPSFFDSIPDTFSTNLGSGQARLARTESFSRRHYTCSTQTQFVTSTFNSDFSDFSSFRRNTFSAIFSCTFYNITNIFQVFDFINTVFNSGYHFMDFTTCIRNISNLTFQFSITSSSTNFDTWVYITIFQRNK